MEWSVIDRIRDFSFVEECSNWWRFFFKMASLMTDLMSFGNKLLFTHWSKIKSAMSSKLDASISSKMVPLVNKFLNSNNECKDNVATWGFDQRFPPSSTSSSNFTHLKCRKSSKTFSSSSLKPRKSWLYATDLAVSRHSISPFWWVTSCSISQKTGWGSCPKPTFSGPRRNWTRRAGGVAIDKEKTA